VVEDWAALEEALSLESRYSDCADGEIGRHCSVSCALPALVLGPVACVRTMWMWRNVES
jgi:hypothetical protein